MESKNFSNSGLRTMQLNDQKAGMQGLDKERINNIIYEASKGTSYFAFQERRQKSIDYKVNELLSSMKKITEAEKTEALEKMTALAANLEAERDLSHSIVHIDMDAFYAAVEMLDDPQLKEKPMAVGSLSMLSTSNYHARKYGVRAAMPGFIAKKLCPELIIVPCNFEKYRLVSKKIRTIISSYDPDFSPASLDEAYLDLTTYIKNIYRKKLHLECCLKNYLCNSFCEEDGESSLSELDYENCMTCCQPISYEKRDQMAYEIVEEIRKKIFEITELTASAGIAPNTKLAKVCSDQNKPNGQFQVCSTKEAVKSFISTLPVKKINGIGPVQGQILNAIGIYTCADMWEKRDIIGCLFSSSISVDFYMRIALGIGSTTVKSDYIRKSIGVEHTFKDTHQRDELHKICLDLCEEMIEDLKAHKMLGKVVVLKIKTSGFKTHTRNHSLAYHSDDKEVICKAARKLLDFEISSTAPQPLKLRLMGIRMASLVPEGELPNHEKQPIKLREFMQIKSSKVQSPSKVHDQFSCHEEDSKELAVTDKNVKDALNYENSIETTKEISFLAEASNLKILTEKSFYEEILIDNKIDTTLRFCCPVCGFDQNATNLEKFNIHIDNCLNRTAIKEILSDDAVANKKRKHHNNESPNLSKDYGKMRRIDEYFHKQQPLS